jgi:hypothetical protein
MNWIGRKRCSVKYAVNGWKGTSRQIERTSNGLIRNYGYSDGNGVNVLFAMSQFSRVFYMLNVFKKMQVSPLKKSHLPVKRSWGFHPQRGVSPM